jgi:uncharacterized protein YqjF (DUF2071 family)
MWTWAQHWRNLLFLHWQASPASVRRYLPSGLEVDTRDGGAWISLVLFRLKVRPTWLPFLPGLSSLTEVNLRTYVTCRGRPGIYFLTLHADNRWAIRLARWLTPLRYRWACLSYKQVSGEFFFAGHVGASPSTEWSLAFRPAGDAWTPDNDSLDAWLLERYRAFVESREGDLLVGEVAHTPWFVRKVELITTLNPVGPEWGVEFSRPPDRMHFAEGVTVRFARFRRLVPGRSQQNFGDKKVGETSSLWVEH